MAYNELIKDFARIRDYMSQFYVYGFKSRKEYDAKSIRSYDNERRRIESWLSDYVSFRRDTSGKNVFLEMDSRTVLHNPLYNVFKAKSFTENDIILHFYVLDVLADKESLSVREITEKITADYLAFFDRPREIDESTIRKKLREYEKLGLLKSEKRGRELTYSRNDTSIDLAQWQCAVAFFSEADPLGAVGSFLLDKYENIPDFFSFKHHYILHALESDVLCDLLVSVYEHRAVTLNVHAVRTNRIAKHTVIPLKIYISTQGGRRYLMAWHYGFQQIILYRLDGIKNVTLHETEPYFDRYKEKAERFGKNLWGVSVGKRNALEHIEMTIYVGEGEEYILRRLEREKRCGRIEEAGSCHYRFVADVCDATEMLPWIRTFIGRITELKSSNTAMAETFYEDLKAMNELYGGDENAVQ